MPAIVYNRFKSAMTQIVTTPAAASRSRRPTPARRRATRHGRRAIYEYEPDEAEILDALLPRNLAVQIFRALLENAASRARA